MGKLTGKKILFFVENMYEDLELWYPYLRLMEEGAKTVIAGPDKGRIYIGKNGYPCQSEVSISGIKAGEFDGLVIAGGFAPDKLRRIEKVKKITKQINDSGKLVAHICHGGWIPISAGIMQDRKCTSTVAIKDDLINAGAKWVDQSVVVHWNMISSRRPADLPDFCRAIIKFLSK